MDPGLDDPSPDLPPDFAPAIRISNLDRIELTPAAPAAPQVALFGREAQHDWCYYFEKADLARQNGDWQQVASLGTQAFQKRLAPAVPIEALVFAEGYAHTGQWDQALHLSLDAFHGDGSSGPRICNLWGRIDRFIQTTTEQQVAMGKILEQVHCPSMPNQP
jgi:hypothetical protein